MTLADIKNNILKYKKYIFFAFFTYSFSLFFLFPYENFIQKILVQIGQQNNSFQFEHQTSALGIFPPRLSLKKVKFTTPLIKDTIHLDQIVFKPSYLSLLAFKLGAKIDLIKEDSSIHLWIQRMLSKEEKKFLIRAHSKEMNVQYLEPLSPFFSHSKGVVGFVIDLNIDPSFNFSPEGSFKVVGKQLEFKPYSFTRQYIGTIHTPLLKWSDLNGQVNISENRMNIENLKMGQSSDSLYLNLNGFLNFTFSKFRQSIREYELEFDLIVSEEIKNQFFFLDLFLSDIEEKTQDDMFQYKTRISGRSLYPPKIERRDAE